MLQAISWGVYGGLAVVSIAFWRRRRTVPAAWLAATFTTLGAFVLQGAVVPPPDPSELPLAQFSPHEIYIDVIVIALLAFPYLLLRFARSLRPRTTLLGRLSDVGMAAVAITMVVAPGFPAPDDYTPLFQVLQVLLLGWWAVVLVGVAVMLFRAGRGRPGVIRNRMRLMGIASLLMNVALLASTLGEPGVQDTAFVVTQLLGWSSAAAFLLAFEPPQTLRRLWRMKEEDALRQAEAGLVTALTAEEAAASIVDAAAALVGGEHAEVRDRSGRVIAATGPSRIPPLEDAEEIGRGRPAAAGGPPQVARVDLGVAGPDGDGARNGHIVISGDAATVLIQRSSLMPVFGEGEEALLAQLCSHLDLSLHRIAAFRESERARRATERANQELTQLVYGVSHDLRNPLVTVLGFVDLLRARQDGLDERQTLAIDRIAISARYMEGLIDDLLQLSRVGRTDADPRPVSVATTVHDIARDLLSRHDDVSVETDGDAIVSMNPTRARQVFTNLLDNAVRHGGQPLHITVRTRTTEDDAGGGPYAEVLVIDDGVGIPREHHERVFQIFQRLERFDASAEGSGIGLTMCKRIVEDVGGSIGIIDTAAGTTFRMMLPVHDHSPTAEARPGALNPQGA